MRQRTMSLLTGSLLLASLGLQGCYGQFGLTHKLYHWNGTLGDKWVNSVVMVGLNVIPVYGFAMVADGLVLNAVEFWTGKNPVAMGPSERQTQVATIQGRDFIITGTQNRLDLVPAKGDVKPITLKFDPEQKAWYAEFQGERRKVAVQDDNRLTLLLPNGQEQTISR